LYMRHIEPWLDSTGWGTQWPTLQARDPDPHQRNLQHPTLAPQPVTGEDEGDEEDGNCVSDREVGVGEQDGDGDDGSGVDSDLELDKDVSGDEEGGDMDQLGGNGSDPEQGGGSGISDGEDSDTHGSL